MKKRMAVWVVVLPLLLLFSTSLVGTALAAHSTVQMKAGSLIPAHPKQGALVVLETSRNFTLFKAYFGLKPDASVCWVSDVTLASLQCRYATSVSTVEVRSRLVSARHRRERRHGPRPADPQSEPLRARTGEPHVLPAPGRPHELMRALYFGLIAITFGSASLYLSGHFFQLRLGTTS